jgi:hypothetical protein
LTNHQTGSILSMKCLRNDKKGSAIQKGNC